MIDWQFTVACMDYYVLISLVGDIDYYKLHVANISIRWIVDGIGVKLVQLHSVHLTLHFHIKMPDN